jgi:streptogramin lyase
VRIIKAYLMIFVILIGGSNLQASASGECDAFRETTKIWWDGMELKKGQIGRLNIIKDTPLYKLDGDKRTFTRTLKKGEFYRIYAFKPGMLSVGGGYYVNRDAKVTYETPSKAKLQGAECVYDRFVNLGTQIHNTIAITGAAGHAPDGTALMYVLLQGEPAKFVAIDIVKNRVWDEKTLKGSTSAWAITVDSSGTVWIGGTPNEHLLQYNPKTKSLTDTGKATAKGTSIHDLEAAGAGVVFGSSSPNGNVFKYEAGKGFTDLGQVLSGKTLARSLAYNKETNTLFAGVGAKAQLVAWNLTSNIKQNILPESYLEETSVYDLDEVNGLLFAKLEPSKKILVFDSRTLAFKKEIPASSRGVSQISPDENSVYYSHGYALQRYNLDSGKTSIIPGTLKGTEAVSIDVIDLNNRELPGSSVVGLLGNSGTYLIYNPATQQLQVNKLNLPLQAIPIYNIERGPRGQIISNGFVSGQVSAFNPVTKETNELLKVGQAESMATLNDKLYLGVYPGASLYEYDPSVTVPEGKPLPLFSAGNGQDRIAAMASDETTKSLFMGTHPKNGEVGGALVVYNPATKYKTVRRNIVPEQSVVSLASSGGYIYGGTSIFSNGKNESNNTAVFFRLSSKNQNGKIEQIPLPLTKPRMIHSLAAATDGTIWGLSDGNLFAYDPNTKGMKTINITPTTSGRFKNGALVIGKDGMVYGTVEQKLFLVNPKTMNKTIYTGITASDITLDDSGNIYFKDGAELWKFK